MQIRRATKEDIPALYAFDHRMYLERENYREIVDHWLSRRANAINDVILLVDDDGAIRGQQLFCAMQYYYNGETVDSTWAFDLIVDEEARAQSQGFSLMWACKKEHRNSLNSGCNDASLPISLKIGNAYLGDLRKYVGITNPLWLATGLFKPEDLTAEHFPKQVGAYQRVDASALPDYQQPFNEHLLEIGRAREFNQWRFAERLHAYAIYHNAKDGSFFVVRTIVKHHEAALVLADYRCGMASDEAFEQILIAFRQLASRMHIGMIIVGSSLKTVDTVCERHGLKSVGRPRPILGFVKCKDRKEDIDNRNFVFWTLADSDGDTTW